MQAKKTFIIVLSILLLSIVACSTEIAQPTPEPSDSFPTPSIAPTESPTPAFSSNPFNDGMIARRNGDYARAITAFTFVLNSNPSAELLAETQFRLAEAYWLKQDYLNAIQKLSAYLQANPKGGHAPETNYFLADAYRATKDYSNALASYRVYRDQSPMLGGDTDATIADTLILAGDPGNAVAQYLKALDDKLLSTVTRILVLQRLADAYQGLGKPSLAGARYDAAYAITPDARTRADLLLKAGEAYAAQLPASLPSRILSRWASVSSHSSVTCCRHFSRLAAAYCW